MRPETEKKIQQIIEANIAAGFVRGQSLFAESLNTDLEKTQIIEGVTINGVIDYLLSEVND